MSEQEALQAAHGIVDAFGSHDRDRYFDGFAPEATFLFHTTNRLLGSRGEYEAEWAAWEADGFRVLACESLDGRVDELTPDVAVFTHRVLTKVRLPDGEHDLDERETIVLRRQGDGRWLGVHEHLSVTPAEDA